MADFILPSDIKPAIDAIIAAGGEVSRKTHAIYVRPTVKLTDQRYDLEVIETDNLPDGTDVIVAEKGEYAD